ncbi:hypothetical protein B5M09_011688 [Aphanomyces astaci]|uniref:Amine oxidase domain-containing protein n=1 Tax=Aphanomyces astaci TaxID=112090 RepID=A0A3R8CNF9_APHAT|nr:hypothetical protein B5M09_011688 [Aphanomyces astaci]
MHQTALLLVASVALLATSIEAQTSTISMGRNDRIVGGGAAGVHYSSLLAKKGFTNIQVLEASDRVGGKSTTALDDRSQPQEMGTVFALDTYTPIFDLGREYDPTNTRFSFALESPNYMYTMGESAGAADADPDTVLDFPHYLLRSIKENAPASAIRLVHALHRRIFGSYAYGLPPHPKDWSAIDMMAMAFIKANNLTALTGMFRFSQQQQGYGVLETIPAFYFLWWSHPQAVSKILRAQVAHVP